MSYSLPETISVYHVQDERILVVGGLVFPALANECQLVVVNTAPFRSIKLNKQRQIVNRSIPSTVQADDNSSNKSVRRIRIPDESPNFYLPPPLARLWLRSRSRSRSRIRGAKQQYTMFQNIRLLPNAVFITTTNCTILCWLSSVHCSIT